MPHGLSKYSPEVLAKAWEYLAGGYEAYDAFPSQVGLARVLDVTRMTINNWTRDPTKPEWAHFIEQLSCEQERVLLNKGLVGDFNATITKLALAKHGYHDKLEHQHSGPGGGPIQQVTSEMSAEEASRIYQEQIRSI